MESTEAALVRRFYDVAWNRWDDSVVDTLLDPDFEFRGSLGNDVSGRDEWRAYRDLVRQAVPDFHNEIVDLVTAPGRAAARLMCSGHHHGVLLGRSGTGRPIRYAVAAFFRCADGRLVSAWVLGDLEALRVQIGLNGPVLDSIVTPDGGGYYMVASAGGIFAFGNATFHGSMGGHKLNAPVQSLVPDSDGVGYWLVASDGGIFAFSGDATSFKAASEPTRRPDRSVLSPCSRTTKTAAAQRNVHPAVACTGSDSHRSTMSPGSTKRSEPLL